jgi:DNA-binding beta-propeller fold protein YncE
MILAKKLCFFGLYLIFLSSFLLGLSTRPYIPVPTADIGYKPLREIDIARGDLSSPLQFVTDEKYYYVIDNFTQSLYKFDQEGDLITKIDRLKGESFQPAGLVLDQNYLYLLDKSGVLHKFNKDLDLQDVYDTDIADKEKFFADPRGMAIDMNNDIYVVDNGMNMFLKLNMLGAVEWRRGLFGSSAESLNGPVDIAVDDHLNIYVLDAGNRRVKVYDQNDLLYMTNDLLEPRGLAVEPNGERCYVADFGRKAVAVFAGKRLAGFITNFKREDIFPQDVCRVGAVLYVLDSQRRKILLYAID